MVHVKYIQVFKTDIGPPTKDLLQSIHVVERPTPVIGA